MFPTTSLANDPARSPSRLAVHGLKRSLNAEAPSFPDLRVGQADAPVNGEVEVPAGGHEKSHLRAGSAASALAAHYSCGHHSSGATVSRTQAEPPAIWRSSTLIGQDGDLVHQVRELASSLSATCAAVIPGPRRSWCSHRRSRGTDRRCSGAAVAELTSDRSPSSTTLPHSTLIRAGHILATSRLDAVPEGLTGARRPARHHRSTRPPRLWARRRPLPPVEPAPRPRSRRG